MGILPQMQQNPYPENEIDLDFCANRNEIDFLKEEERKYNPKKNKNPEAFVVPNGQRQQ